MPASHHTRQPRRGRYQRRGNDRGDADDPSLAASNVSISVNADTPPPPLIPAPLRPQRHRTQRPSPLAREFVPGASVAPLQPAPPSAAETTVEEARSVSETQDLPDNTHPATPNITSAAMELTLRESTDSVTSGRQGSPNSVHGLCRFFQAGCCTRGEKCWYKHELEIPTASETVAVSSTTTTTTTPSSTTTITTTTTTTTTPNASATADPSEVETCSICFDKPETYGLMTGCDHIFCLSCIRKWRCSSSTARNGRHDDPYADDPHALASTSKTCPLCRVRTRYIIPSVVFPTTTPQKKQIERVYRLRLSNIPCRYFVASLQPRAPPPRNESGLVPPHGRLSNAPWCPFGNECHYQHQKVPGVPYNFSESELARAMWGQRAAARRRAASRWGREGGGRASYGQEWVIRHIDDDDHTQHENTSTADADDDDSWDTADMAVLMAGLMEIHGPAADWGGDTTGVEAMDDFLATAFS